MVSPMSEPIRKKKGCFFYGCITSVVLLFLLGALAFFGVRSAVNRFVNLTDTKPRPLPVMEVSDADWKQLETRLNAFTNAYEKGEEYTLELNSDELNAVIARHPNYAKLRGKVILMLEKDSVRADMSVPLSELPLKKVKDRYLNASAQFTGGLENGKLELYVKSLEVKGKPLEDKMANEIVKQNFASETEKNPQLSSVIKKLQSVEVRDGILYLKTKHRPEAQRENEPEKPAPQ
jgi:hypothetical protein